ncbi:MAG: DUF924 domain-containing protein [Alphaproteobacteria bacterium]|nr:MAG: DUF924 domain-containing protein [Alphaproteobacteria bacterium]
MSRKSPEEVLAFWFEEASPEDWFTKSDAFDAKIDAHFRETIDALTEEFETKGTSSWEETPRGALAAIITLDQFPRNIFRGTEEMFRRDPLALALTKKALSAGYDDGLEGKMRQFLYMPLMHSEDLEDQELCVRLFETKLDDANSLAYAIEHRNIIRDFGLFPHRNKILGRETTPEQQAYLDKGGFAG